MYLKHIHYMYSSDGKRLVGNTPETLVYIGSGVTGVSFYLYCLSACLFICLFQVEFISLKISQEAGMCWLGGHKLCGFYDSDVANSEIMAAIISNILRQKFQWEQNRIHNEKLGTHPEKRNGPRRDSPLLSQLPGKDYGQHPGLMAASVQNMGSYGSPSVTSLWKPGAVQILQPRLGVRAESFPLSLLIVYLMSTPYSI